MRKKIERRKQAGFTLVELMAALVVLGVLAGAFVAGAGLVTRRYRVRAATRQVVSMINYARTQATVRKKVYRIRIGSGNQGLPSNTPATCRRSSIGNQGWIIVDAGSTSQVRTAFQTSSTTTTGGTSSTTTSTNSLCVKAFFYALEYKNIEIFNVFHSDSPLTIGGGSTGGGNIRTPQNTNPQYTTAQNSPPLQQQKTLPSTSPKTTKDATIDLYFMPDGRVLRCTLSAASNSASCTPINGNVCIRLKPSAGGDSSGRIVEVGYNGLLQVNKDDPNSNC